jgi:RHS repeat-associated protein
VAAVLGATIVAAVAATVTATIRGTVSFGRVGELSEPIFGASLGASLVGAPFILTFQIDDTKGREIFGIDATGTYQTYLESYQGSNPVSGSLTINGETVALGNLQVNPAVGHYNTGLANRVAAQSYSRVEFTLSQSGPGPNQHSAQFVVSSSPPELTNPDWRAAWTYTLKPTDNQNGEFTFDENFPNNRYRGGSGRLRATSINISGPNYSPQIDSTQAVPSNCKSSGCTACGCANWNVQLASLSLQLSDTPIRYRPPVGYPINLDLYYSQRDTQQPDAPDYSNFGPKWTSNWVSFITYSSSDGSAKVFLRGGGGESFTFGSTTTTAVGPYTQATLSKVVTGSTLTGFRRRMPDGSYEEYLRQSGTRFMLTGVSDPQGNVITVSYDTGGRITEIVDPLGKKTAFSYGLSGDALKITKVTDPFGRSATFSYASGKLASITDTIGITSSFNYVGTFIDTLTTPYGVTRFAFADGTTDSSLGSTRVLTVTDALGQKSRYEYNDNAPGVAPSDALAPTGMLVRNADLNKRNTFVWNPQQLAVATASGGLDYTKARVVHWAISASAGTLSRVPESIKEPLEGRVWFNYVGQTDPSREGTTSLPTAVGRVLDDGSAQLSRYAYNAIGNLTETTDPLGRKMSHEYSTDGIDRLTTSNTTGGVTHVLASMIYDGQHNLKTLKGANGATSSWDYNASGQVLKATNQLGQATSFTYENGYLIRVDGPIAGAKLDLTYDAAGRVAARTNSIGTKLTYSYDDADRLTKVTYPDGTTISNGYTLLDLTSVTDRMGKRRTITRDALRRVTETKDALNRIVKYAYAPSGQLTLLTDERGNQTQFTVDIQGRSTGKIYADGTSHAYVYEANTSRLKKVTDAKGQTTTFAYYVDDMLASKVYGNAVITTPDVHYTYDARYRRPLTMTDGNGTTRYAYHDYSPDGTLGANQLKSVTSPVSGSSTLTDTISYSYDALGRVVSRTVNGSPETTDFDELGRVEKIVNDLGNFQYGYADATPRVTTVTPSSGPKVALGYYDGQRDELLKSMAYTSQSGTALATYGYEYDANGNVTRFEEAFQGQFASAVLGTATDTGPNFVGRIAAIRLDGYAASVLALALALLLATRVAVKRFGRSAWIASPIAATLALASCGGGGGGESGAGGGTTPVTPPTQVAKKSVTKYAYDLAERLMAAAVGTDLQEPSAVDPKFAYSYDAASNLLTIKRGTATASPTYSVTNGISTSTYDSNGNTATHGGWTYTWDAADRIVKAVSGTVESAFTYDGGGRIVRVADKTNNVITKDRSYVWCGLTRCAERDNLVSGSPVVKRYFAQGELAHGSLLYYGVDHLGSVRQLMGSTGTIQAQYAFEPYGTRTKIAGSSESDAGFAGLWKHQTTGLDLSVFRGYDSMSGRWINRDPIAEAGGVNLYGYVGGNAINSTDRSGLRSSVNKDGSISIRPEDPTVPHVTIGPVLDAQGVSPADNYFHDYNVPSQSSAACDLDAVESALAASPTPGPGNSPAALGGTVNDAGPLPFGHDNNYVNSFLIPSTNPNQTDIVVNYTIGGGHTLQEGFVIRWGVREANGSITLRSYGEGNSWMQTPLLKLYWQGKVDQVWRNNQRAIFGKAGCSCQ